MLKIVSEQRLNAKCAYQTFHIESGSAAIALVVILLLGALPILASVHSMRLGSASGA